MKTRTLVRYLSLFFIAQSAFAGVEDYVVKTKSYLCSDPLKMYAGSGVLFNFKEETYVLTSDHVVLSGTKFCHSVQNEKTKEKEATLVASDYGRGIAILKLKEKLPAISFEDFFADKPAASTKVQVMGFPWESEKLVSRDNGVILLSDSERGLIPLQPKMIEVTGGHAEYGMSGGIIISSADQKLLGIVSHQALKVVEGAASKVGVISNSVAASDHFFAIPVYALKENILDFLKDQKASKTSFVRAGFEELQGKYETAHSFGLRFEYLGPIGSGGGIGGPEGAGKIGGNPEGENGENTEKVSQVVLTLSTLEETAQWSSPARKVVLERIKSYLLKGQKVSIPYFVDYSKDLKAAKKIYFRSLSGFLSLFTQGTLRPVIILQGENAKTQVKDLIENTAKLSEMNKKLVAFAGKVNSLDLKNLTNQITLMTEILSYEDYASVNPEWIKNLLADKTGWQVGFNSTEFELTVEIMALLHKINQDLGKLTLIE